MKVTHNVNAEGCASDGDEVSVVIVGSVALDSVETKFDRREDVLGGSASYAGVASALYAPTGLVGVTGHDFPADCLALYRACGLNLEGLECVEGLTFRWSGVYDDNMISRQTLSTDLNVFADFNPRLPPAYRKAPFLLLGNIAPGLQLSVLEQSEAPEFVIADTMDLWINIDRDNLLEVIRRVNLLMLNDEEARQLTGVHNLRDCASQLLDYGLDYVVIKKGEHGAMLVSRDGLFLVSAFPVDAVIDPTGAGDTFAGACIGYLAAAGSADLLRVRQALRHAAVVASFGVEGFSLESLREVSPAMIQTRLSELEAMTASPLQAG